ncbi:Na(+)/H(+) antiporter subunit D [Natronomonas gomsonensis]|uniref:Na(+)/H(+) antiporter subunit D n=1 Tax=Natronomonas gomsonensis TaxID=1046043 RepID=UPI0015BF07A5|nr:Na(+)/H(+) antiporter subunit D [Natronomonas gomsonensis]
MIESIPPFVPVLIAAAIAAVAPRKVGHAVGFLATAGVAVGALLVPDGTLIAGQLFGFETVLYQVDDFSRLMGLIFGLIGAAAVLYSYSSEADGKQTAAALGYVGTSLGAVFAGDWLTLVFFWELMAVTSTLLVWHYGGRAVRTGFRYALAHGIGGTIVLGAVVWQYVEVGSFLFSAATGVVGPVAPILMAVGIGVNVGFIGLHTWLPDTYPSPHIAASVFLCVYTTKTGVYAMFRAFPEGHLWIAYMGGAMAVFGASMALLQEDMRRLLSYHIISQVGYMVAGVGITSELATAGAFGHIFNHILYKALLFMSIGVVIYRTGIEDITEVGGLWKVMPVTFISYLFGAAAISGVPGFNGFVSKGIVIAEAHYSMDTFVIGSKSMFLGGEDLLWWMLIIGGVGTFMSFIKLGYYVFFHGPANIDPDDAKVGQAAPMLAVGSLCLAFGLLPGVLFELLPYTDVVTAEYTTYTVDHVVEGVVLGVAGFVGFFSLKNVLSRLTWIPDVDRVLNPAVFYGGRALVVAVTETWAAVDRVAVAAASGALRVGSDPQHFAYTTAKRLPGIEADTRPNGGRPETIDLQVSMGTSVFLIVMTLLGALAVLLL